MNLKLVAGLAIAALVAPVATADPISVGDYYVDDDGNVDDGTLFQESNGLAGLQKTDTVLEDGTVIPPDSQIA